MRLFLLIHYYYVLLFYPKWVTKTIVSITWAKEILTGNMLYDQPKYRDKYLRYLLSMRDDIHFLNVRKMLITCSIKQILHCLVAYRFISKK